MSGRASLLAVADREKLKHASVELRAEVAHGFSPCAPSRAIVEICDLVKSGAEVAALDLPLEPAKLAKSFMRQLRWPRAGFRAEARVVRVEDVSPDRINFADKFRSHTAGREHRIEAVGIPSRDKLPGEVVDRTGADRPIAPDRRA